MKQGFAVLALLCLSAVLCGADSGFEGMSLKDVPAVAVVSPQAAPAGALPLAPKEWTVIIYMNGNGVMPTGAYSDLDSMESVGSTQRVNVVVQLARNRGYAARHYVVKDGARGFNSPAVQTIPNADMGDYKTAADFISWAKANYPAKRYALVFWAHGMGYKDPALRANTKGFSPDTATSNYITTPQLGLIMKQAGAIDVLGFSSCLMQMAEVVYEMKDNVGVVVGSEEPLFGFGFDYSKFIKLLDSNPAVLAEAAGDALAREYFAGVKKRGEWSQISVVRPAAMDGLLPKLDAWAAEAMAGKYEDAFYEARVWALRTGLRSSEERGTAPYGDLFDFITNYASKLGPRDAKMKQLCQDLLGYISSRLVVKNYTEGFSLDYQQMNKAGGISIHLPARDWGTPFAGDKGMRVKYSDYAFSRDSKWDEFLKWAYPKR